MANLQKYTSVQLGHLLKHYERAKNENGEYIKFGNQSIDTSKTYLNYDLAPKRDITQYEFLKQRKNEVKCLNRKDVNVMCSWIITLPKSFPKDKEKEFFEQSYEFLKNKYGEKNVISSYVHLDEKQPHMHFSFIPVVIDKKKRIEKISAKELINQNELKVFHKDLKKHLENYFNFDVEIWNDATKDGNKTIKELKQMSSEIDKKRLELQKITEEIKNIYKANKHITKKDILAFKNSSSTFLGNYVKIEKSLFEKISGQLVANYNLKNKNIELSKENQNLKLTNNELAKNLKDLEYGLKLVDNLKSKISDYEDIYKYIDQNTIDKANLQNLKHKLNKARDYQSIKNYTAQIQELENKLNFENKHDLDKSSFKIKNKNKENNLEL